ncbi:Ribonuclease BN [Candidatus Magnetaquicoccaceae bacterium FCR-1]|uniref:Ribonuclease BN n=1 Tax=Candidatus Magnetaquiglobus chichijimensis TaxID=3141448 RepID=A0ABQ0C9R0_9PROT
MKVIVLGSGTGVPSLRRGSPAYWLGVDDRQYLIDCGSGTLLQLERIGASFRDLDGAFITHVHADHIGDLTPMVHAMRLPGLTREKPFTLHGPPGFTDFFNRIIAPVAAPPTRFPFLVQDAPLAWNMNGLTILSHPTPHSDRFASRAYRFEHQGRAIVFSGDTDWDDGLAGFLTGADLALLECSTLDDDKVEGHLTPGLCGRLAAMARVRRLLLTHFYPIDGPDSLFLDQCRAQFSGELGLAEDRLSVEIAP